MGAFISTHASRVPVRYRVGGNITSHSITTMKTKLDLKSIVCGGLLGAALVFAIGAATGPTRTAWEYRIVDS